MQVVVALQRHEVAIREGFMYNGGQHTEVGGDGHGLFVGGMDAVAHAGHIVAGGEGFDPESPDLCFPARRQGRHIAGGGDDMVLLQKPQRLLRAVHRQRMLFQEGGKPLHMVAVLVGDKDAVAVTGGKAQRLERRRGSAHALAHIHNEIPLPAAHHTAVAGGTRI